MHQNKLSIESVLVSSEIHVYTDCEVFSPEVKQILLISESHGLETFNEIDRSTSQCCLTQLLKV